MDNKTQREKPKMGSKKVETSYPNPKQNAGEEVMLTDSSSDSEDSVKEIEMKKPSHPEINTQSDTCESPKSSLDKQATNKLKRKYKKKVIYRCQLFAPIRSQAAQCTKNIIRYFTWYGQTLRNVQSRGLTKVPWGKPIDACQYTRGKPIDAGQYTRATGEGLLRRGKRIRTYQTKSLFDFDESSEDEFLPSTKRKKTGKITNETTANAANENECVDLNIIEDSRSPELNTDLSKVEHNDSVQPDANSVTLNQSPEIDSTPVISTFSDEETQPYATSDDFITLPRKKSLSKGHDSDSLPYDATSVHASDSTLDDDQPIRNSVKKAKRKQKSTKKNIAVQEVPCDSSDESEEFSILEEEKTSHQKEIPDLTVEIPAECPVCFCLFSLKVIEQHASECMGKKPEPQTRRRLGVRNVVDKPVSSSLEEVSTLQTDLHSPIRQDCDIATVSSKSSNTGRRLMRKRKLNKVVDNISLIKQGSSKIQSAKTQQKQKNKQTVESQSSENDFSDGSNKVSKMSNSQGKESKNVCTQNIKKANSTVSYSNSKSSEKESKAQNLEEVVQNKSTIDNNQISKQRNKDDPVKQLIEINDSSDTEDESVNQQRNSPQSDTNSEEIPVQMERRSPPVKLPCEEEKPGGQECPICSAVVQPANFEMHVMACVDLQEARQFENDSEDSDENQTRVSRITRSKAAT